MSRLHDVGLLIARAGFGGFMLYGHGWGKMSKLLSGAEIQFADPIGLGPTISFVLAAMAESVCAALVALGLFTRLNLLALMFTMFVAAIVVHGGSPFGKKEMGLLYLTGYTTIFLLGPGKYTLQSLLEKRFNLERKLGGFLLK